MTLLLYLTQNEERAFAGEYGYSLESAYRVLLAIGRLSNAKTLVPVKWAHVSGVSYLTIGDYGSDFLRRISSLKGTKFKIFTTVNPCGMDMEKWDSQGISADYAEKQLKIIHYYQKLGAANSFTCVPFQTFPLPAAGTHVSWAESSAAIFANSFLGLRTNRESAVSALASALTGKTVYSDLHLAENRKPSIAVRIAISKSRRGGAKGEHNRRNLTLEGSLDFGLLGYFAGKHTTGVVEFQGLRSSTKLEEQKALCAALGTVGSCGMLTIGRSKNPEVIDFTDKEYDETFSEISDSDSGDAIVFGCPQMTIEELYELSKGLHGKHLRKKCVIFCSSKIYELAKSHGYVGVIEAAGAFFVRDACADFTPLISSLHVDSVLTDSVKGAHYMKRYHKVKTALKDTLAIISENAS